MSAGDRVPPSNEDLLRRFQDGEREAFAEFYSRNFREVVCECQRWVQNWVVAQDLAHDVFLRLYGRPGAFREASGKPFAAWLRVVARNISLNHLKRFAVARSVVLDDSVAEAASVFDPSGVDNQELIAAMDRLSPDQRLCLKLFYFEERSYAEIAEITGMSPSKVRSSIQNGRLRLERALRKDSGERR